MAQGTCHNMGNHHKSDSSNHGIHHRIRTLRKTLNLLHRMGNHPTRKTRRIKNILRKSKTLGHYSNNNSNNPRMGTNDIMPKQKFFSIKDLQKNDFSLVLSGGSSLGLAHIGIIEFLEENNLHPSEIIGTSMGSIIGALYAIGNTSETIKEKIKGLKTQDLFEIKYFQGRIEYKKGKALLKEMFHNKKIAEAKIPLKIIATNIKNGDKKIFSAKDNLTIYDAILASTAIPGVLTAKRIKREIFIDGGVSSNLPIEVANPKKHKTRHKRNKQKKRKLPLS